MEYSVECNKYMASWASSLGNPWEELIVLRKDSWKHKFANLDVIANPYELHLEKPSEGRL